MNGYKFLGQFMSENNIEQQIDNYMMQLVIIASKIDTAEASSDMLKLSDYIQIINSINEQLKKIKIKNTDNSDLQVLYAQALSYIEPLRKRAELLLNKILDKQQVQDRPEGIKGNKEHYYQGLDFAEAENDGNCFYYSIAAALNAENQASNQQKYSQKMLREQVADFYQNSSEEQELLNLTLIARKNEIIEKDIKDTEDAILAANFIEVLTEKNQTLIRLKQQLQDLRQNYDSPITDDEIKEHIKKIRTTNEWADESTIAALSKILKRPIVVVEGSNDSIKIKRPIHGEKQIGDPIFVHYNGANHYNALIVQPSCNAKKILENLKQLTKLKEEQVIPATKKPRKSGI